jgi:hypothetical protein
LLGRGGVRRDIAAGSSRRRMTTVPLPSDRPARLASMDIQRSVIRLLLARSWYADELRDQLGLEGKRELGDVLVPLHQARFVQFGAHDGHGRPIALTAQGRRAAEALLG